MASDATAESTRAVEAESTKAEKAESTRTVEAESMRAEEAEESTRAEEAESTRAEEAESTRAEEAESTRAEEAESMSAVKAESVVVETINITTPERQSWLNSKIKVIDPEIRFYQYWQSALLIAISVGCLLTVYQSLIYSGYPSFWVIVYCVDALNLVDTVLTLNVGFYDMTGTLIIDRFLIWRRYLRTSFITNVASLLPIELFSLLFTVRVKILARLRLNRLFGLLKAYKIIDGRMTALDSNGMLWQLVLCVFMFVFVMHICAAVWFVAACNGYHDGVELYCYNSTWAFINEVVGNQTEHMVVETAPPAENYLVSLYFVVISATTTGYGDITAQSHGEILLAILVMLLGMAVCFGLILGTMSSLVTNWLKQKSNFMHKISTIQFNLRFRNISDQVQSQVIGYYEYLYLRKSADTSNTFLYVLPYVMRVEFHFSTSITILEKAQIFADVDVCFLRMLSLKMIQVVYLPKQIVASRGESGQIMFYIHRGELEILSEEDNDTPIAILQEGKIFGEVNLFYSTPRVATVRAKTHCDLVLLYKKDLDQLIVYYPEVGRLIAMAVKQRCRTADDKAGIEDDSIRDEGMQFEAMRSRTSSFVPTTVTTPFPTAARARGHAVLRMLNKDHDRLFRMQRRGEKSINFSACVQVVPVTLDEDPLTWRETPYLKIRKIFNDLIFWAKMTIIDPESPRYIMWDDTMAILILCLAIIYPYMAFFSSDYDSAYLTTPLGGVILRITYVLELLLFLDIFVTLRTAIVTPNGKLSKFKFIIEHYVKTWVFVCDVFSSLPIEVFSLFVTSDPFTQHYAFGVLKLNRLLKFYRVSRALTWRETSLKYSGYAVRYGKLILYSLMTSHWGACWLYAGSCTQTRCSDGWIKVWTLERRMQVQDGAVGRYVISLYSSIVTLTNTGFGDRCAMNTKERFFAIVTVITGFLVFGYGLSLLSATITHEESFRTMFQERLFAVSDFMKEHGVNKTLRMRVIRYISILWDIYGGEWFPGQESLLHEMPMNLQLNINMEDIGPVLKQLPLFRYTDDSFIKELAHHLVPYIFNPGEFVMYAKEPAKEMYILIKGHCERLGVDDKNVISVLGPGDYFGATSMLFKEYKTSSVRTKTCCLVYELKMSTLMEVLVEFPAIEKQFHRVLSDRSVLDSRAQFYAQGQARNVEATHFVHQEEKPFASGFAKAVRLRNSLGVVSFKKTNMGKDNDVTNSPLKHLSKCSWLISRLLMRHTLLPDGTLLFVWTVVMTVIGAIVTALVPLHIAFIHTSTAMWIFLYILDGISLFHVYFVGPNTGYYNEENVLVLHPHATSGYYLRKNFLLDLLGCLPYELILIAIYRGLSWEILHFMALLRLNRMLQFYRVVLAFDYLEMDVYRQTINLRKIKYIIYLIVFINWMASLLFFFGCPPTIWHALTSVRAVSDDHLCSTTSWVFSKKDINLTETTSTLQLYTISLYLSSTTFSSVGYGDFIASLEHETVGLSIVILTGQLFFTYILASITACVASADAQLAHFKEKMMYVKSYMEMELIDMALQNRVTAYYEHLWLMTKGVQPHTLFSVLPLSLWSDVTLSLYEDVISSISLFHDTERSFVKTISRYIKPVHFLKGEFIVKKFDIGREMYFIHRGGVDVVSEDGATVYDTMNAGQAFGEVALLFSVPRTASIRAQANSYLFMLEKEDLDTVLEFYPAIKIQIMRIAEVRQQQARKRSAGMTEENNMRASDELEDITEKERKESEEEEAEDEDGEVFQLEEEFDADQPLASFWGNEILTMEELKLEPLFARRKSSGSEPPPRTQSVDSRKAPEPDKPPMDNNISKNNPSIDDDEDEMERPRSFINIINPRNKILVFFKAFICFLNLASCIIISYQAAFQDLSIAVFTISYFIDFCVIIEIFLNFHLAYYDAYGDLVENLTDIRRHYLRNIGGFPLDFMTTFPFELLALAAPYGQRVSVLAYIRLIHLVRFYSIGKTLHKLSENLSTSMLLLKILSNLVSFTCVLHFVACLWFIISCDSKLPCRNTSMEHVISFPFIDGEVYHTPGTAYLAAFYWSTATATSTGYGDVLPVETIELWFTIAVLMITRIQMGFIIGDLTSALVSVDAGRSEFKEQLDLFKKVLADRKAPPEMEKQMVRYYNRLWLYSKGVDVRTLLKDLPVCLRAEIMQTVAEDFWKAVPFFQDANNSFTRLLSLYTGQLIFTKGNCIIRKGDLASDLYFIKHGQVEDITDKDNPKVLKEGQVFGFAGMLSNTKYRLSVNAITAIVILTLSYADLCKVLRNYPNIEQRTKDFAKTFYDVDFKLPDLDTEN